ncbi:MAG: hypothetical protein HY094_00985 [Candidatus Melainabacteria bacterium]|nr:hypothetical protein [Candidatus Melainabacteria bacterium]
MKITNKQKTTLIAYVATVFFICVLCVPWISEGNCGGVSIKRAYGYSPIWFPPKANGGVVDEEVGLSVDIKRILLELFALSLVCGTVFYFSGDDKKS